ncbi:hypothetical protein EJB05_31800, partial [Eragrostis curvula]
MREPRQRNVVRQAKQQQRRPSPNKTTELSGNRCFSDDEEELLIKLHALLGNRWSLIAGRLPGRTDEEVKNHWDSQMRKLKRVGVNPDSHRANHLPSPDDHQQGRRLPWKQCEQCPEKHPDHRRASNSMAEDCVSDDGSRFRAQQEEIHRGLNLQLTLCTPLYFGKEQMANN